MRNISLMAMVLLLILVLVPVTETHAETSDGDRFLLDFGNGTTQWSDASDGGCYGDAAETVLKGMDMEYSVSSDGFMSVGEMANHAVGSQECGWKLFAWSDGTWAPKMFSDPYAGGSLALGFYPDTGIVPAETPDEDTAWIQVRSDSASSGYSDSTGPAKAVTPVEWYRTYTTGYVDSSIVIAGNLAYHTTGGTYGASGTDRDPWLYCLDRYTGEIVWQFHYKYGQGYEVTSPLVVGDMVVITATNGSIYALDRFDGTMLHNMALPSDYPLDENGDVRWEGRTFYTGATSPVYDSGGIYFGTGDGHVMCYTLEREAGFTQLWDYNPPDGTVDGDYTGTKGCFYYHAPTVVDIDGTRMLFIGSYEGYVYALDASDGSEIWVQRMIDLDDQNQPHPGTPGSAATVSVTPDGKLLVTCTDGGMSALAGYLICIDASTGRGSDGSDYDWKLDILANQPVISDDCFFTFVSPSYNGSKTLEFADGSSQDVRSAVYRFDYSGKAVWASDDYQLVKAPLTMADGKLYAMDYSAGVYYPTGGGLMALDTEDGSEDWRIKLSPYSKDSYSMVSPTVIDGKIYVGNDYGAVYCVSEVMGKDLEDSGEIELDNEGFGHWSWFALIVLVILSFIMLYRFY